MSQMAVTKPTFNIFEGTNIDPFSVGTPTIPAFKSFAPKSQNAFVPPQSAST